MGDQARFAALMDKKYELLERGVAAKEKGAKTNQFTADTARQQLPIEQQRADALVTGANARRDDVAQKSSLLKQRGNQEAGLQWQHDNNTSNQERTRRTNELIDRKTQKTPDKWISYDKGIDKDMKPLGVGFFNQTTGVTKAEQMQNMRQETQPSPAQNIEFTKPKLVDLKKKTIGNYPAGTGRIF